jgi:hypothetical protein
MTYANSGKDKFLNGIPQKSFDSNDSEHTNYCKFCFAYFCKQAASQNYDEWEVQKLHKLLNKFQEFGKFALNHWEQQPIGRGSGRVLTFYGAFPTRSDFTVPLNVPNDARWGRFRLDYKTRLVGFMVPRHRDGLEHPHTHRRFDSNTFYVVFLDAEHRFYKSEDP